MVTFLQPSFAGGEISPSTYGRIDLVKYGTGAKTLRNFFVLAWGGVSNRPGFKFVGEVADSTSATRNIPFAFNTTQTYTLEFSNLKLRIVKDGAYVTETAVNITGVTAANPAVVTSAAHGYSNGDHVYISGIVGMTQLNGRTFKVANKTANTFELTDLGGTNINSTSYTAYSSGGTAARVYTVTTPYAAADLFDITYVQSADTMTLSHPSYAPRDLTRTGHASWTITTTTFASSVSAPTGVTATATVASANPYNYTYVVTAISSTTGEESVASSSSTCTNDLSIAGNFNTITWNAVAGASNYYVYKDDRDSGVYGYIGTTTATTIRDKNIDGDESETPQSANNPFSSSDNYPSCATYFQERRIYANTNTNPQTFWGSVTGNYKNMNKSFPVQDDDAYQFTIASRQVNEIRHMVPLVDLLILTSGGEFIARGGDGQGSKLNANSIQVLPQSYRGSSKVQPLVIGNIVVFIQEQGQTIRDLGFEFAEDGYTGNDLTVMARHLFEGYSIVDWCYAQSPYSVVWAVRSDGVLLSLTYLREHQVWGWAKHETEGFFESVCAISEGSETAVYAIVKRTVNGCTVRYQERMESRVIDDVRDAFFVDSGLTLDSPISVTSITAANPPVVTTATHGLTTGDIIDFGELNTTTYDTDNGGWEDHDASNQRYQVTVTGATTFTLQDFETGDDIDGTEWGTYDGTGYFREAVTTLSNLWHLEGRTVSILADGNVHPQATVSSGSVTLDYSASRVHIGLPYSADVETLPIEIPLRDGTAQGRRKTVPFMTIRMEKSRGGFAGMSFDDLYEMKQATEQEFGQPIDLITGDFQQQLDPTWGTTGSVCIRQTDPLPITVLAVIPEVQLGGH